MFSEFSTMPVVLFVALTASSKVIVTDPIIGSTGGVEVS